MEFNKEEIAIIIMALEDKMLKLQLQLMEKDSEEDSRAFLDIIQLVEKIVKEQ